MTGLKQAGRTKNALRNSVWGLIYNVMNLFMPFAIRTIILYVFNEEYLGLNSLFSSIIAVLSLAELGFGSAVVYSMYKPIAENDTPRICAILRLYKRIYLIIGIIVLASGLAVTPFLPFLIHGTYPHEINIYLIFIIFLVNSSISYFFFSYRESVLQATQRNDIVNKTLLIVRFLMYVSQIAIIFLLKNYYLYLIALPIATFIGNAINYLIAKKTFPDYFPDGTLESNDIRNIKKQVGGLMISKIAAISRNSMDNIAISVFVGLTAVAIYSNYFYIMNAVHGFLSVLMISIRAGIGNSIAKESKEKNYRDFKKFTFLYSWISGICACCFLCCYQHFMLIWVDKSELVFPFQTMVLFVIYFYLLTMMDVRNVYIDATGVWWQNKTRPIVEALSNIALNFLFAYFWGVDGILWATIITVVFVNLAFGSRVLFKEYFTMFKCKEYLLPQIFYFLVTFISCILVNKICEFLPSYGFLWMLLKLVICLTFPNLIFLLSYLITPEYAYIREVSNTLTNILFRKRKQKNLS